MTYTLQLFGGLTLVGPDGVLTGPATQRKRLALLALLAASPTQRLAREKLLGYLWPARESDRGRHQLSSAIYVLRRATSEDAILSAGDEVWLNGDVVRSDLAAFEAAIERGDAARAVSLYTGPFLEGFFLRRALEFERWTDRERARFAAAYRQALEELAEAAEARGADAEAVEWWRTRATQDPYDSRVALRLMRALDASGNRPGAIQHAAVHARLLEDDLGLEPSPEVRGLAERLRADPAAAARGAEPAQGTPSEPPPPAPVVPQPAESAPLPPTARGDPRGGEARRTGRRSPRVRWWVTALATLVVVLALGAVIRVAWSAGPDGAGPLAHAAAPDRTSIAVLPFVDLSPEAAEAHFSDGLTEELIGTLARVRALQVVARTSAFAFKGAASDVREIGRTLGVGTILEGSVRREGDRVRVTAQLIDAADGFHLWSETYQREGTDLFELQRDLALEIANTLEARLSPAERARLMRRPTAVPEAHVLYLQGRHFWNQRTREGFARAIEYYQRAIEADPSYAQPHAGLAMAYSLEGVTGSRTPSDARARLREAAEAALALDGDLVEAHVAMGMHLNVYAWDSEASETQYERAFALDPHYATAHHMYANLLSSMGRVDEELEHRRTALALDPLVPAMSEVLGRGLLRAGRFDEALSHMRNALALDSTYWRGHVALALLHEETGRLALALEAHRKAVSLAPASVHARSGLARVLARMGQEEEARALLAEIEAEAVVDGMHVPSVATVHLALGEVNEALDWLERSYREGHPQLRFLGRAGYERLLDDPRYHDLRRRVGLAALTGT